MSQKQRGREGPKRFGACLALLLVGIVCCTGSVQSTKHVVFDIPAHLRVTEGAVSSRDVVSAHGREEPKVGEAGSAPHGSSSTPPPSYLQLTLRFLYLLIIFSPVIATSGLAVVSNLFRTHVWFWLLSKSIAVSGAAFIKWGQWASTRPDIFPSELCTALAVLQANAPEHSWAHTRSLIQTELGKPVEAVFEIFDAKPIASGSIAQVYRARLNGQDVAVKVRHPHGKPFFTPAPSPSLTNSPPLSFPSHAQWPNTSPWILSS